MNEQKNLITTIKILPPQMIQLMMFGGLIVFFTYPITILHILGSDALIFALSFMFLAWCFFLAGMVLGIRLMKKAETVQEID